jgi:hypothetical protein
MLAVLAVQCKVCKGPEHLSFMFDSVAPAVGTVMVHVQV